MHHWRFLFLTSVATLRSFHVICHLHMICKILSNAIKPLLTPLIKPAIVQCDFRALVVLLEHTNPTHLCVEAIPAIPELPPPFHLPAEPPCGPCGSLGPLVCFLKPPLSPSPPTPLHVPSELPCAPCSSMAPSACFLKQSSSIGASKKALLRALLLEQRGASQSGSGNSNF